MSDEPTETPEEPEFGDADPDDAYVAGEDDDAGEDDVEPEDE